MSVDRSDWPWLVRIGLWSVHSAAMAWFYLCLSLVIAVVCGVLGAVIDPIAYAGVPMVLAALWYFVSIQWVNRHGQWGKPR